MHYRAEVDGLRALAVIPVVLFHAGIASFSGGFIGVDIFFVISGYLITAKIYSDLERGTFDLWDFYERRARRILPLLIVVLAVSIPVFHLILVPSDYSRFVRSAISSLQLTSDIFFRQSGGYFDAVDHPRPLLHTWSLSIEEKYYIAFPLIFALVFRKHRSQLARTMLAAAAIFFAVSIFFTVTKPTGAYYMFFARIWEILAGAAIVVVGADARFSASCRMLKELAGWMSIAAISVAFWAYDEHLVYPGMYALVPVLGTCALIVSATPGTSLHALFTWRPLVFIGMLSYSIYMWHQPVIVAAEERGLFDGWAQIAVLLVILALSVASWAFVEQPFRRKSSVGRKPFFVASVFSLVAVVSAAKYTGSLSEERVAGLMPRETTELQMGDKCFLLDAKNSVFSETCRLTTDTRPRVLLVGDSHSASIFPALKSYADKAGFELKLMSAAYCLPLATAFPENRSETATPRCAEINRQIITEIEAKKPDLVVLAAYMFQWSAKAGVAQVDERWTYEGYYHDFLMSLADLARSTPVLVIGQLPIWKKSLPDLVALDAGVRNIPLSDLTQYDSAGLASGLLPFDATYRRDVTNGGARYVSVIDGICRSGKCPRYTKASDGKLELTTFDYGHLSEAGGDLTVSAVIAPAIQETFNVKLTASED
ncbi:acyltransferase family protein [Ensifer sp. LC163]|uniref:acyltransferase family protein n=1 Tax=Ensifer sp. LC163 TaxID=1120652 RepID=UPI0013748372|nr:acyltransferase family protein [Ensifer sp. LC163]